MSCNLAAIEKACRSTGGLKEIIVFLPEQIRTEAVQACGGTLPSGIYLKDGEVAIRLPFASGTAQLRERLVQARSGDYYEQEVPCTIPGDSESIAAFLETMKHRRAYLRTLDNDGNYRLLRRMRLEHEFDTDTRLSSRKGTRMRWVGQSTKRAPLFNGYVGPQPSSENWADSDGGWFDSDGGWEDSGGLIGVPADPDF